MMVHQGMFFWTKPAKTNGRNPPRITLRCKSIHAQKPKVEEAFIGEAELLMYVLTIDCAHLGELAARAAYILISKVSRHCHSAPQHGNRELLEQTWALNP